MMAHNLCYTTLLDKTAINRLNLGNDVGYIQTPNNGTPYDVRRSQHRLRKLSKISS
jgi:hypothetical protein